ncbi:hypothetical protein EVAR_59886_1 [Eumeta japonica]|uniref:Uncharacterized protein n=1 Tax=Eumeta variegata TaxID=151549 RepID=A0A4C2AEJ0_EUMVA|nr:hypothetical protein EVAR_59886_1 [Eumeta japonica]
MAVSHACLTHSVYVIHDLCRVGHTSLQPPPSRQSELLSSFKRYQRCELRPLSLLLCCRSVCPGRVQVRTAPGAYVERGDRYGPRMLPPRTIAIPPPLIHPVERSCTPSRPPYSAETVPCILSNGDIPR